MALSKNWPLYVGLAIPIIMVLLVAASIYLPRLWVRPQYDFLYSTSDGYYIADRYVIQNGELVRIPIDQSFVTYSPGRQVPAATLYRHDTATNRSREIGFAEAQNLTLDQSRESPDGFTVEQGSGGSSFFPFFFSNSDYDTVYLKGRGVNTKLNVSGSRYSFSFIAWIK